MDDPYVQEGFRFRLDWGPQGLRRLAPLADVVVVVDVLSFTTAIDVAVSRGATVLPYRWRDGTEAAYAEANDALLASTSRAEGWSLSPASLRTIAAGTRLVLPSPNGSALSFDAAEAGARVVLAGCLRNASAVGAAAAAAGHVVAVVAAGERWRDPDPGLRVAVEDLLGAGAVLAGADPAECSPEARAAQATFASAAGDLAGWLDACASGRELTGWGHGDDVAIAAEHDVSATVPELRAAAFTMAP